MKRIFTVRTTALEAFRFWFWGQTENNESWNTEAKVIATIEGRYEANIKADYGTAGHKVIEDQKGTRRHDGSYVHNKFVFTSKQVQPLLQYCADHPFMIRETPVSKLYHLKDFDLIITGTVDALEGNVMRDNKFKFSNYDVQEFIDSVQHKIYLDALGMKIFYYDFFNVKGFETLEDVSKSVISPVESMLVTAYPTMQEDIMEVLEEFSGWVQHHRLQPFLTMTPAKAAKIIAGDGSFKKLLQI